MTSSIPISSSTVSESRSYIVVSTKPYYRASSDIQPTSRIVQETLASTTPFPEGTISTIEKQLNSLELEAEEKVI